MKDYYCPIYEKHSNTINGIYLTYKPDTWEDIMELDEFDLEDEDGEILNLLKDVKVYDANGTNPKDPIDTDESIFLARHGNDYYLCESQNKGYVKYAVKVNSVPYIKELNREAKLARLSSCGRV